MTKPENRWIYAVYKGDKYLTEGTKEEICEELGIARATFNYYRTQHWKDRCKNGKNYKVIIRIDNI